MKRIGILAAIAVALIALYLGARAYNGTSTFEAPSDFRTSEWQSDRIDHIRLAFPGGKEIDLRKKDGKWTVNDLPADQARVDQVLTYFDAAEITSRVSTNPANHASFDVDAGKGLTATLFSGDEQIQQVILGKTAGGETVYARLPEKDEVYVMSGVSRYYFVDELNTWRDRSIANFSKDTVRQIEYTENQIYWKLLNTTEGWTLASKWIGPIALDKDKVDGFLATVAGLQAMDFATKEAVDNARDKKATFAKVVVEVGTPETFERRETWSVYTDQDRYLVVRESDSLGFYVSKDAIDPALTDYADIKTRLIPSPSETTAQTPESETK